MGAHLHFELHDGGAVLDPFFSLASAQRLTAPRYPDPDPSLVAGAGETRWDGIATAIDPEKGVVVLELTGSGRAGHAPTRNSAPRLVYLSLPAGTTLRYRGAEGLAYPIDAIRPGVRLSSVGTTVGSKMRVRAGSMALSAG